MTVGVQPFDDDPLLAFALDGSGFVFVERRVSGRAAGGSFRVTRLSPTGDTIFSRSIGYRPVPVTRSDIDSAVEQLVAPLPREAVPELREAFRKALYVPQQFPAITAAFIARDGRVWLRRDQKPGVRLDRWLVLDPRGRPISEVSLDRRFFPFEIVADVLWGILLDDDGGSSVVKLRARMTR
jgi:hypothetical protein